VSNQLHLAHPIRIVLALCSLFAVPPLSVQADTWGPITVVGREIAPGTSSRFPFIPDRSFEASYLNMPVYVAHGAAPGPALCLTAGIHGDELNGVEIARRAFAGVDPKKLRGTVYALPAINAEGVRSGNRYLSDRRDLNRAFPGSEGGSVAAKIAYSVFTHFIEKCSVLIDLHTASDDRTNLPQVRADLANEKVRDIATHFGTGIVVGGGGPDDSLRREAVRAGVAAIIYEAGGPHRFEEEEIARGVEGVDNIMKHLGMIEGTQSVADPQVLDDSTWIRATLGNGGFFFPSARLGDMVGVGDPLGHIVDPLTDEEYPITSSHAGQIIGMAVPQPVLGGSALFHVGFNEAESDSAGR
jgi:predicted deacylase